MLRKLSLFFVIGFLFMGYASCDAQQFVKASDPRIAYTGRASYKSPDYVAWNWPGFQIHASFSGSSLKMKTSPGSGYFMVVVDGQKPFKVESTKENGVVEIASGLSEGQHRVDITYCIEGLARDPKFYGFLLDNGGDLTQRPSLPERKIEFIGNSITCGLGIEGNGSEKKATANLHNVYYTYAARTARALDAQWMTVARSGLGIYRNTLGNPKGDKGVMPDMYPYTFFNKQSEMWDFNQWQPDVVCIGLGTNDTTNPSYDVGLLTDAFKRFIKTLRNNYPNAKIVMLTGTMIRGQRLANLKKAQDDAMEDAHQRGDKEVYRFDFTPADGSLGYGCFKHPSMRQNEQMANELVPFLKQITGW